VKVDKQLHHGLPLFTPGLCATSLTYMRKRVNHSQASRDGMAVSIAIPCSPLMRLKLKLHYAVIALLEIDIFYK
jgi:hypothetical protein